MKYVQSYFFRALCAIIVGVLLVKYREQTVTWITVAVGLLFFVSGAVSCLSFFAARRKGGIEVFDADGRKLTPVQPSFPVVGVGCALLGLVLALMPDLFVTSLMYILAAALIVGAVGQFYALVTVSRVARVGVFFWLLPVLTLVVGFIALISPESIASAPLFVIGWCMIFYGVVECVNALKIRRLTHPSTNEKPRP